MFRQGGITVLELLIGLSITSGVSLYTMKMTEEVEEAVGVYQEHVQDVQALRKKLKALPYQGDGDKEELLDQINFDSINESILESDLF